MKTGDVDALERAQEREDPEGRGPFLLAATLAAAFALQHCYDPAKAPPVDPGYPPPIDLRARDAGADR